MIQIIIQADIADQIRRSEGQVELIDDKGNRIGVIRRLPTEDEVQIARSRIASPGPKLTMDEVISKLEAL